MRRWPHFVTSPATPMAKSSRSSVVKRWPRAKTPASCAAEPNRAESREGAHASLCWACNADGRAFGGAIAGARLSIAERRATLAREAEGEARHQHGSNDV